MRKVQNAAVEREAAQSREGSQSTCIPVLAAGSEKRLSGPQTGSLTLKPYHQTRWVCPLHGFFDLLLSQKTPESYIASCPECKKPAARRAGYECTGQTSGPLPRATKPRLDETPEIEISLFDKPKVVKNKRGFYNRYTKEWERNRR